MLCRSRSEADAALELIRSWVEQARLTLHPTKTHIVDAASEGFDFLGYHFERGYRWPRKKSLEKLKDKVRQKTKRTCGASIKAVVADLNRTLPGWFGYFQYSHWTTFRPLDAWIRMCLRKHQKKRGRGRGSDHQRWPNVYFAELGVFSLETAHASVSQSALR